ncbi:MAG: PBP1A family penicillin-binding protein, partial [Hyphomicrobiales bacterium]|nr:PBP1A family penicillin-binding protein [Hyphomicrobiales bacterium]
RAEPPSPPPPQRAEPPSPPPATKQVDSDPLPSFIQKWGTPTPDERTDEKPQDTPPQTTPPSGVNKGSRPTRTTRVRKQRSFSARAARFALYWGVVAAIWLVVMLISAVVVYSLMAEDPLSVGLSKQPAKITILSSDNRVISEKGVRRSHVPLSKMPPHLLQAVLTTEDRRFYYHYGVDPLGITRAFIRNYRAGRIVEGGSTITQQLVKVLFLKPNRTYWRKIEEMLLSLSLEYRLTKEQILELYLNRIYFGGGNYGVAAATQHYFGKDVSEINLYESAILAGLIRSPTYYAPTNDFERSLGRGKVVLSAMKSVGELSEAEYAWITNNPPALRTHLPNERYGFVIDTVMQQLTELGLDMKSDMVVETVIDYEIQAVAQHTVQSHMDREGADYNAGEAAAVLIDRNGAVRALIGGRNYQTSQFNRAINARRQPGSTFKPFVFLAALENGMTPNSMVHDGPLRIGNWSPSNYNKRYHGDVTMREALAKSMNTVAVRLSEWVGPDEVIKTAHRLGVETKLEPNASIALGTSGMSLLELVSAYVPFANSGFSARPHIIKTVKDADGNVVYDIGRTNWGRIIAPQHVADINDMLTATILYGTGNQANIDPHPAAGKTGTGQGYRDAWFVGYTAHYVAGVWVGNDDFSPMKRITGGSLPTKIWRDLMVYANLKKDPSYLPGTDKFAGKRRGQQPKNKSFWDDLFGNSRSRGPRDTTLGTPIASSEGTGSAPRKRSWLEDFFAE